MSTSSIAGRARSYSQGKLQTSEVPLGDLNLALDDASDREDTPQEQSPGLARSFLLSGFLHALALLTLVSFDFQTREPVLTPESIAIQLRIRPSAPQPEPSVVEAPVAQEVNVSSSSQVAPPPQEPLVNVPSVEPSPFLPTAPAETPEHPTLRLLTPESLRDTIDGIADRRAADDAGIDCTPLQEQSEIIDCGDEEERRDVTDITRNATYEFFTRQDTPVSRTQRTIGDMAVRADSIARQLLTTDIGGPAVERFLRELRSTSVDISRSGNVQLDGLREQMHSNDTTYQQQQRAFNPR